MQLKFKKVTHVLFDLDGLLLDSETLYGEAYKTVGAKYDAEFTWNLDASVLGYQAHEIIQQLLETFNLQPFKDDFLGDLKRECFKLLPDVKLMPGAEKLVKHLYEHGVPMALATSTGEDHVTLKMQNHQEIFKLFDHITMGRTDPEVTKGKPDPAIFRVCASRFPNKPRPQDCLVFEDAVNGMNAANAANMQVVLVPDTWINMNLCRDATLVLNSLEDFKPEEFGLPAYNY